jgi:NitT/TauT family transport system substrate-binding protein
LSRLLAVLVLVFLATAAVHAQSPSPTPTPLRLAVGRLPLYPPALAWYIGEEKGIFKRHGLNLEIRLYDSWGKATEATATGQADGNVASPQCAILADAAGAALPIVLVTDNAENDRLIAMPSIRDVRGLRGKRIVTWKPTSAYAFLYQTLHKAGLTMNDVTVVSASSMDEVSTMWLTGKYDAAVMWEPYLTPGIAKFRARVLARTRSVPGIMPGMITVNPAVLQTRAGDIQKLVDSWLDISDWLRAHPDEGNAIMAKHAGLPVAQYNMARFGVHLLTRAEILREFTPLPDKSDLRSLYNLLALRLRLDHKSGLAPRLESVDALIDGRFVRKALGGPAR